MDVGILKQQLASSAENVCCSLLPNGVRKGKEWCVGSIQGEPGESLKVRLTGSKAGQWSDFATGQSGDLLDLYCAVHDAPLRDAIRWAKKLLNITEPEFYQAEKKQYRKPERPKNAVKPRSKVLQYLLEERALSQEIIDLFKLAEQDSHYFVKPQKEIPAVVFPYIVDGELLFLKYLAIERPPEGHKKWIDAEAKCEPCLFGWQSLTPNARTVTVCEGEINACSWKQYGHDALATPFGAGRGAKHDWINTEWERLQQFETIYLNFDQDEAGRLAVNELAERLGRHRCLIVPEMPDGHKDINDCLKADVPKEQVDALLECAETCDPAELRQAFEFTEDVVDIFYPKENEPEGMALPFASIGNRFRLRLAEVTFFTGYTGDGKTELLNLLHLYLATKGERCCVASFEIKSKRLLSRLVRQATCQKQPSEEYIRRVMQWTIDKFWLFDHVGSAKPERILEVFEYALQRYGVRYFVIDSLMRLQIRSEDYERQEAFACELANFASAKNVHISVVVHPRKDKDDGSLPGTQDLKGSSGLANNAHNIVSVWRNKMKEVAKQKTELGDFLSDAEAKAFKGPDAAIHIIKQREGDGETPYIPLTFDVDSKQHYEPNDRPRVFVPFEDDASEAVDYMEDILGESPFS